MAHKTNSKEQFLIKFYNFKFSFELRPYSSATPQTSFQGAYTFMLTRRLFPTFETNLLSLKYYEVSYPIRVKHMLSSTNLSQVTSPCDGIGRHAWLKTTSLTGSWFDSRYGYYLNNIFSVFVPQLIFSLDSFLFSPSCMLPKINEYFSFTNQSIAFFPLTFLLYLTSSFTKFHLLYEPTYYHLLILGNYLLLLSFPSSSNIN